MRTHLKAEVQAGATRSMGVYIPAKAPFIIASQHDEKVRKLLWEEAKFLASRENRLSYTLDVKLGEVAYQEAPNGGVEIAAYYYDTSD